MAEREDEKIIDRFPQGLITPPPSKSLCHRALLCAALAAGDSVIHNVDLSEDIQATLDGASTLLGAAWTMDGGTLRLHGKGTPVVNARQDGGMTPGGARRRLETPPDGTTRVACGESGSTLRFLIPLAALTGQETVFTGRGRLMERPMDAYAAVFAGPQEAAKPGAAVGNGGGDRPRFVQAQKEIRVRGPLCGGRYTVPGDVSSQFISGLLLALPLAPGDSEIRTNVPLESRPYVSMTIDVMRRFGVEIRTENGVFSVPGGQRYRPAVYTVEADYSQAAFFLAAAALGRDLRCAGLDPNSAQGDRAILRILEEMGAAVLWQNGLVSVRADRLCALEIDVRDIPDLAPPLAALCCFCEGESRIVNAGRLRLKESDRLRALASELGALGADITEGTDSLTIRGRNTLPGGRANARNDHRIAMTVALAAIRCQSDVRLTGWRSVRKSYPDFWRTFGKEF